MAAELIRIALIVVIVEVGAYVTILTEFTQLITKIMLSFWSARVISFTSPTMVAVVVVVALTAVVGIDVDRRVGIDVDRCINGLDNVLLHLLFTDWFQLTTCGVASVVVRSTMPKLTTRVPRGCGPRVCKSIVDLLLNLGVGDLESRLNPSHLFGI